MTDDVTLKPESIDLAMADLDRSRRVGWARAYDAERRIAVLEAELASAQAALETVARIASVAAHTGIPHQALRDGIASLIEHNPDAEALIGNALDYHSRIFWTLPDGSQSTCVDPADYPGTHDAEQDVYELVGLVAAAILSADDEMATSLETELELRNRYQPDSREPGAAGYSRIEVAVHDMGYAHGYDAEAAELCDRLNRRRLGLPDPPPQNTAQTYRPAPPPSPPGDPMPPEVREAIRRTLGYDDDTEEADHD